MAFQRATKPEGPTGEFKGDIQVDDTLPNMKMLEKANRLTILDADKKKHTFKSLYAGKGKILNCQEYIRTLSADLPPATLSALPIPTSLILIGCGSADLIPMYKRETNTPFPVYADPTRKIYDVLGMTRTLSLGDKEPKYMRQPLYRVILQSFVQELKSGRHMLSGGDFWQVGGEFLFGSDGTVRWCHRMRNTRDHAELDQLRKELQMSGEPESTPTVAQGKTVGSRRSMSGAGLVRKLSDRRKSWRNSMTRNRFRITQANGSVPPEAMEKLKEEDDAPEGDRDAALAKLTGNANRNADAPAPSSAVLNGGAKEPAVNGTATEGLANGTAEPPSNGSATEGHPDHTADKPIAKDLTPKLATNMSAIEPTANGSTDTRNANGILHDSTPFVQSLMNGSIDKKPSEINGSANSIFDKAIANEAGAEVNGIANGQAVKA